MVWTSIGYVSTLANDTLAQITFVADTSQTARGNGVIVPSWASKLMGCYMNGTSLYRGQIQSPSIRDDWFIDIEPVDTAATVSTMYPYHDWSRTPVELQAGEEIDLYGYEGLGTTETEYGFLQLCDGPITPFKGKIKPIRATGATTLAASVWTAVPLTFPSNLPAENYYVVGARFHSATCKFGRLLFPGYGHRPGCPGFSTAAKTDGGLFRLGNMGIWGQFNVASPPQAEMMATTTDSTEEVFLDLVPIG